MKKYFLTLIVMLIGINNFAQKVKIDKGEIKLYDKTIGFIEGKKPIFTIFSVDKNYSIIAELKKSSKRRIFSIAVGRN